MKASKNQAPRLKLRALHTYLSVAEAPKIRDRRLLTILVLMGMAIFTQGVALMGLVPLKERVPYMVEVETSTGAVRASARTATQFTPSELSVRYHLQRWIEDTLTVDEHSRGMRLPASYAMVRGNAIEQWRYLIQDIEQPIQRLRENPEYRREARIMSFSFLDSSQAMVRLELRDNQRASRIVMVTLSYAILPPQSDEDAMRNPIGLWITHFGVVNESL